MRDEYRRRVLNRWKSLEGHVRGVRRMIGELLELFNGGASAGAAAYRSPS